MSNVQEPLTLLILAALAGFVLFQLYNVLGKRVGRQPEDVKESDKRALAPMLGKKPDAPAREPRPSTDPMAPAIAAFRQRDPTFEGPKFLDGARKAFETIVSAYAAGDRESLRPLLAPPVMGAFEQGITAREQAGRTETVEFLHAVRPDLEGLDVDGNTGRARVRFLSELRTRSKGPEGEAVDDRRTAEVWTFERSLISRDPNWTLVRVEAAEG